MTNDTNMVNGYNLSLTDPLHRIIIGVSTTTSSRSA